MSGGFSPLVSVIMNCRNGEKFLAGAIDSVYGQAYTAWEIVLLDNASTDRTYEIAHSYDEKVRYFHNETMVTLGQARNQALRHARGKLIAFLDSDDTWLPSKLEKQVPLFEDAPSVGIVFSDTYLRFQNDGRTTTWFRRNRFVPPRGRIFVSLMRHYSIPMLTAVIRSEALHSMPQWFDDRFQVCDDFDFFMRLAYDWDCDYVDEPLAMNLIHDDSAMAKLHRLGAGELTMTLEKILAQHPELAREHPREVESMRMKIAYWLGNSNLRDGNFAEARQIYRRYITSPKFLLRYASTVLPGDWVDAIYGWLRH